MVATQRVEGQNTAAEGSTHRQPGKPGRQAKTKTKSTAMELIPVRKGKAEEQASLTTFNSWAFPSVPAQSPLKPLHAHTHQLSKLIAAERLSREHPAGQAKR